MDTNNEEQRKLWNGPAGDSWVEAQELLDGMFEPLEARLVAIARRLRPARVLDVGCGTGATTLAMARALPDARCVGIDLSEPMVRLARQRAARAGLAVDFLVGDAQIRAFEAATFDLVTSRFGVMFFADPVRAFGNLRHGARAGAALHCLVFRRAEENAFMTAAERAAAPLLPGLPPRRRDAPGQFAFADAARVETILAGAGWRDVHLHPIDVACAMPAAALDGYLLRLGPVGLALRDADAATRARVLPAVRAAFDPYLQGGEVRFTAACWEISAAA